MHLLAIGLTLLTAVSTMAGGLVAIRYRDKPHLILGFTAGVLLGVVTFDVLPEIMDLVNELHVPPIQPMIALVVGFLAFHIIEKLMLIHEAQEESFGPHIHPHVGKLSALALIGHSFIDGVGIGLGFAVNESVGIIIAIAVISHDFSDGLNTVTLLLEHKNTGRQSYPFLVADALAPVLGALSTLWLTVPDRYLLIYLGVFAGFLLYIGASDILPQAHSRRPSGEAIVMTIIGAVFMYLVVRFSQGGL